MSQTQILASIPTGLASFGLGKLRFCGRPQDEQISIKLTQAGVTRKMLALSERIRCVSVEAELRQKRKHRELETSTANYTPQELSIVLKSVGVHTVDGEE